MNSRYSVLIFFFGITSVVFSQENLGVFTFNIWDPADIPFWDKHTNGYPVDKLVNYVSEDNADVLFAGDFNSPPAAEFPSSSKKKGNYTYSSQTTHILIDTKFNDAWMILPNNNKKGNGVTCPGQDDYIKRVDQVYFKGNGLKPTYAFLKRNLWESINLLDHNGVVVDFVVK
ncbi:hypothetical protein SAMN04487911_10341 [Arenibacter nanhaiticus]|uniref:Endonuclease/Exonuclease/phosphatase family protein n=1 Tax=Arenibacter nanhaiticus TaxID=558155 RepID=A0A1M6C1G2_9FLAO|nr:hypothetical protein [Arenibacter nanhaiticus]SHI54538.1 hypothetical protein SAMN04487911_10341 [Arenibacter nanhaiticus]